MNFRSATINSRVSAVPADRDVVGFGIERIRQLIAAGLVPRPQQFHDFIGELAVVGDGVERFQRRIERLAPCGDLGLVLRQMLGVGRPW